MWKIQTKKQKEIEYKIEKKLNEGVGGGENDVDKNAEPAPEAPAANELEEEKDRVSDSHTVSVNETAPDPVLSQPEEQPAADSTSKEASEDSEKEKTTKNDEAEPFTKKCNESSEANTPTKVGSDKEAESSVLGSIEEDKPEHMAKYEEEKPKEIETKEIIDEEEEEQVKTIDVSTLVSESTDKPTDPVDHKAGSPPQQESTKDTENSELGSTDRVPEVEEPSEPEKESTEKREEELGEQVNVEESSAAPSDQPSDAVESNSPKESNEREVVETEPTEEEKRQPVAIEVKEKPGVQAILTEKLEGEHQDTELGVTGEDAKNEVEKTKPSKEDGISVTECVELVPAEQEVHTNLVESSPAEADNFKIAELKKEVNESSDVEKVGVEELKKELNETTAGEVFSREVAEPVFSTQEAQADTREDEKDSSLSVAAEEVGIDVENKETNAVKVEEVNEQESVKTKDVIPVAGNEVVHSESKSELVTEAVKDEQPPESKPDAEEEPTVKTEGRDLEIDQAKDMVKTDVQNPEEPTKESDHTTQTSENHEEVPAKQKQSNNIFSKVKLSLAKAKKAITGKSPNSKTVSYDTKGDVTAK